MSRNHRETFLYKINRTKYNNALMSRSSSNSIAVPAPIRMLLSTSIRRQNHICSEYKNCPEFGASYAMRILQSYKEFNSLFFAKIRKPHLFKTFFQCQFLFDLDEIVTNKDRIKSNFTL